MVRQQASHRNKPNRRLRVQDVQGDAGGTSLGHVPVMLLAKDAVQPGVGAASFSAESALGLCASVTGQHVGGDPRSLVVEQKQGEEDGVDDIAVQTEGFLLIIGARVAVEGAEATKPIQRLAIECADRPVTRDV